MERLPGMKLTGSLAASGPTSTGRMGNGSPAGWGTPPTRRCLAGSEYDNTDTVRPGHGEPDTHCWLSRSSSDDGSVDRGGHY